ncbi:MAG: hypothetical protein J1E62_07545 [Lachnospiraceae bacterium]|nr:hypothetical protein [Lachnospiraceae bacterium]
MGRENQLRKPCIRCLLRDLDRAQEYEKVTEYIANMEKDIKVSEDKYERRLALCRECDSLYQGICGKCGCFVEVRAVRKIGKCPHEEPRW